MATGIPPPLDELFEFGTADPQDDSVFVSLLGYYADYSSPLFNENLELIFSRTWSDITQDIGPQLGGYNDLERTESTLDLIHPCSPLSNLLPSFAMVV